MAIVCEFFFVRTFQRTFSNPRTKSLHAESVFRKYERWKCRFVDSLNKSSAVFLRFLLIDMVHLFISVLFNLLVPTELNRIFVRNHAFLPWAHKLFERSSFDVSSGFCDDTSKLDRFGMSSGLCAILQISRNIKCFHLALSTHLICTKVTTTSESHVL